ncbi:MAG: ATP phosphoribosyltransferase regulatory subunit [Chloroflexi bacterium]|nr:ATP phosphoribosyltransferase regulatory subunit [Chloroflexota bacterium]
MTTSNSPASPTKPVKQIPPFQGRRLLPEGVKDLFGTPAAQLQALSDRLRRHFSAWGYDEVIPPTFEYFDTLALGTGPRLEESMYRFFDREGQALALRPDLTVPIARIAATRCFDQPLPQRYAYVATVFRYEAPHGGQQREFYQAGAELIGAASPHADTEILALAVEAIRALGIQNFRLSVGHIGFFRNLLSGLSLSKTETRALIEAVDRRNVPLLNRQLARTSIPEPDRQLLASLPGLCGGPDILDRARNLLPANHTAHAVIDYLGLVYQLLEAYGLGEVVMIDFGEVRGMDYYTGITFEAFAAGSGYAIASGGRYDDLLARFGADLPAVGFALLLERAMRVLERAGQEPVEPRPDAIMVACAHPPCLADLLRRRAFGQRVELDVAEKPLADVIAQARERGIPTVLSCKRAISTQTE